ncbi:MarR family winged helix-turn-helix transcriptional regulator [Phytomonospora endophytica]|uniref:DNA-binding MarR family transcriptional regulator n=1 Tax=Phytomonospora endophytica TaxID=714109 RepID=A0A841FW80_9ACTN|nr:MarR family winged helix-turn-helix transcriptional regulator [Phytomonospora endophytica]MBB6037587.1 DNA-binding MarR family transcriptional regulator [Phytomonospora endophytica]GIG67887.1 MarR family transcriptional regulator [Phytomonospora endophytica]
MDDDAYPLGQSATVGADDIAAAWRRELPGVPTHSIPVVTPIWRLAKLLADDRRRFLADQGVDAATLDLISTLRRAGEPYTLSTRELAARCLVSAGAISQRVARAEKDGLVTRGPARGRPKTVPVTLTAEGHGLTDRLVGELLRREAELIGDGDHETLAAGLRELLAAVGARTAQ